MSLGRAAWIECDRPGCDARFPENFHNPEVRVVKAGAKAAGWWIGQAHFCPDHRVRTVASKLVRVRPS